MTVDNHRLRTCHPRLQQRWSDAAHLHEKQKGLLIDQTSFMSLKVLYLGLAKPRVSNLIQGFNVHDTWLSGILPIVS